MSAPTTYSWNPACTPEELHTMLQTLSEEYPISETSGSSSLLFEKTAADGNLSVSTSPDGRIRIRYSSLQSAARGLGNALAGRDMQENMEFKTFGIMLDCSRNAVMTVPHLKKWLRRLALMGYNMVMLYTEDTYELPDEPYFGYLRGRYSLEEMQEVDRYAAKLGIEMVGCIQTLGHLEQPIHWGTLSNDTARVLLVDDDRTYALIDKMLDFWRKAFRSSRIHIGMDETHDLGRGKFMDRNGYERGFDIFNRHLQRVSGQCAARGLKPIIWSDMYFRMGNKNRSYYNPETVIPEDVKQAIPADVTLCYWDYYHGDQNFYEDWIDRHCELGALPHMASGIWTWGTMWYNRFQTVRTVRPCIAACRKKHIRDFYFTMWGDNGAYCDFDSAMAGLAWGADLAWGDQGDDEEVALIFQAVCGAPYKEKLLASEMLYDFHDPDDHQIMTPIVLWDDPLLGIAWREHFHFDREVWTKYLKQLQNTRRQLEGTQNHDAAGDMGHACNIFDVLIEKILFRMKILDAYPQKDRQSLQNIADSDIPRIIRALRRLNESFRKQWLRRNKPFGLEIIQIRFAGQIERFEETARRIHELLNGTIENIPELEISLENPVGLRDVRYSYYASGCLQ